MTYAEKLTDPRWQKKRLEILNRDNFTCQLCDDKDSTLHVHHKSYGVDPWDSKNKALITYCLHCHLVVEFYKKERFISIPVKVFKVPVDSFYILYVLTKNANSDRYAIYSFEYNKSTNELDFKTLILPDLLEVINKEIVVRTKK